MKKFVLFTLLLLIAVSLSAGKVKFKCTVNSKDGFFKTGETVKFTAQMFEDKKPAENLKLGYRLMYDKKAIKCGFVNGNETLSFTVKADRPGWIYLRLFAFGDSKRDQLNLKRVSNPSLYVTASNIGGIGAMVEPEKLRHSKDEPADFDEFWNGVKKELAAVPCKLIESKPVPQHVIATAQIVNPEKYNISDVKIACAGQKPVSGYLSMPKNAKKKSLPAMVTYHGAGVRSARLSRNDTGLDIIVFDVNAHGIENSMPNEFYQKLYNETYKSKTEGTYPQWGKTDRNTYYFKGMYMRVMRALEYVKSLPEWDGKTLVVSGGSQGGAQVLAACALDHDITLARAKVPAMCDHFADKSGRVPGWPSVMRTKSPSGKHDPAKIEACMAYYDGVYFAKRIKCPIYVYTGFIDTTCSPTSVFAAYNNIPDGVKKSIYCVPTAGHSVPEKQFDPVLLKHIGKTAK